MPAVRWCHQRDQAVASQANFRAGVEVVVLGCQFDPLFVAFSEAPVGFKSIRLAFELETEASEEELATLLKLTERYCVVFQSLRTAPELSATLVS